MTLTPDAQRNHDALFPGRHSTLKLTDPELLEIFDDWAFDDVTQDAPLEVGLRLMVLLAATIDLLHPLPFIGYPRTLNALRIINEGTSP